MKLSAKLDLTGGYRIVWHDEQYWVIGNGISTSCGQNFYAAKYTLDGMTESPSSIFVPEEMFKKLSNK